MSELARKPALARGRPWNGMVTIVLLALVLTLVLAACGSDDDTDDDASGADDSADGASEDDADPPDDEGDDDAEPYYASRDIEVIIPFAPGGGNDLFGRFIADQLGNYVEGSPAVQANNVEGGGAILGTNEFELRRDRDGTSILATSPTPVLAWALEQEGVEFSPQGWRPLFGVPGGAVAFASPDVGIDDPLDLVDSDPSFIFGGLSPAGVELIGLLAFEILGLDVQYIFGYEGTGPTLVAFEQGEVDLGWRSSDGFEESVGPMIESGDAIPLFSAGFIQDGEVGRDPRFPDYLSLPELYEGIHGEPPSGEAWEAYQVLMAARTNLARVVWVHEDIPPEAMDALSAAMADMVADPEFASAGAELFGGYDPVVGEDAVAAAAALLDVSDDVLTWLRSFVMDNFGDDL